jgi:hypothetical protein
MCAECQRLGNNLKGRKVRVIDIMVYGICQYTSISIGMVLKDEFDWTFTRRLDVFRVVWS